MTVYGPATGNYSRDSIRRARESDDATAGDQIINGKFIDNTHGTNNGTNDRNTGSGGHATYTTSGNGSGSLYNSMMKARKGYLSNVLSGQLNNLETNFNNTMADYNHQETDINDAYNQNLKDIQKNTYQNIERDKVIGTQRGMMNSQQQVASEHGTIRAGNENQNQATIARNNALNDLTSQLNALKANFEANKFAAQKQYDAGMMQAIGEAQTAQNQRDWNAYQFDTTMDWNKDQFGQSLDWEKDMFGQNLAWDKEKFTKQLADAAESRSAQMRAMQMGWDHESQANMDMFLNNLQMAGLNGNFDNLTSGQQSVLKGWMSDLGSRGNFLNMYLDDVMPSGAYTGGMGGMNYNFSTPSINYGPRVTVPFNSRIYRK